MQRILLPMIFALTAGCYAHGDVGGTGSYSYGYAASSPSLYYVSPGVQVVAHSEYPVFYSDNYYWRYDNGLWYRSGAYNSGWITVEGNYVPHHVRSIDRPHSYARFTPGQGWSRTGAQGTYQGGTQGGYQGGARDHRTYRPAPAPAPAPYGRDHRTYQPAPPAAQPARDHRTYNPPAAHNPPPARDHRSAPVSAPRPTNQHQQPAPVRDHRK